MADAALHHLSATELAGRIARHELSAREYLEHTTVVPVGFTTDGLPLAVQIVGPYLEDRTALAVARALRSALGPMPFPEAPRTPVA
jgi:Asp-tRNA(Asn)/Glu-tRNA(Gln) amidotransferase A subunit family amidase